jgi:hypothetical protein
MIKRKIATAFLLFSLLWGIKDGNGGKSIKMSNLALLCQ